MKPRIALTANREGRPHNDAYCKAVEKAGGVPIVLPLLAGNEGPEDLLEIADGLLLTGGRDINPARYGQKCCGAEIMDSCRERSDFARLALADEKRMPVLGICLGVQEMAVHRQGSLIQHIPNAVSTALDHGYGGKPRAMHDVEVTADTLLARIVGPGPLEVNSTHHQAVREPGCGLVVVARSDDKVIEAIEDPTPGRFFLGVQWHPEDLIDQPPHLALFQALCRKAAEWRASFAKTGG